MTTPVSETTCGANPSKPVPKRLRPARVDVLPSPSPEERGFQLILVLGALLVLCIWIGVLFTGSAIHGAMIGIVATIIVAWKTLDLYLISVPSLQVWVVLNNLTHNQYVFTRGWWLIPPWCKVQFNTDTRRELRIESDKDEQYTTKDGMLIQARWLAVIQLRAEDVLTFIQTPEEVIADVLDSIITRALGDWIAAQNADEVLAHKDAASEMLAGLFCGEEWISDWEDKYGVNISDPKLFSLIPDADTQKAMSGRFKATAFRGQVNTLVGTKGEKKLDAKVAAEIAQLQNSLIKKEVKETKFEVGENLGDVIGVLGKGAIDLIEKVAKK